MSLSCKNIKINVTLKHDICLNDLLKLNVKIQEKKHLYILRYFNFHSVITIYKHSLNKMHITGIKKYNIKSIFLFIKEIKGIVVNVKIDNSMFICKLKKTLI